MTCDAIKEKLGAYVDGELALADRRLVEEHVDACSECSATLEAYREIASKLAPTDQASVPEHLWTNIESRLDPRQPAESSRPRQSSEGKRLWVVRPGWAIAASLALIIGLGVLAVSLSGSRVQAAPVDFGKLLDELELDPRQAFRNFVQAYRGKAGSRIEAKSYAAQLDFELPEELSLGFRLRDVYLLDFGGTPGVAASYLSSAGFLAVIFHPPVQAESFGTHEDYDCVVGKHRGHKVEVGEWKLVHVTDATTCHCVLSKLDEATQLPAILYAVAPRSVPTNIRHDHD